jgi:hypothetical protein
MAGVTVVTIVLVASLVAGCGSSSSTTVASTTSTGNGTSPVCAAYSQMVSFKDLKQLDPSNASQVKAAMRNVNAAAGALSAAVSLTAGNTGASAQSAVSTFQSQFASAQGQPTAQQVATVQAALKQLESSLHATVTQLGCKP